MSKQQTTTVVTENEVGQCPRFSMVELVIFVSSQVCIASSNIIEKEVLPLIISEMTVYSITLVLILHPWS